MKKLVWKYLSLTVASIIYSCGVSSFIDANNFAPGGVSGLCISLNRLIPLEIGTLFFLLNIPILILGLWKFGWKFIASTLYEIVLISGFSNWFSTRGAATADPILGALFGGTLIAVGMGIAFKCRATTGGMDIIVKVIKQKFPYLKTGTIFLLADAIVIGFGGIVFQNLNAIFYSVLAEVVTSRVLDLILYGTDGAKLLYIISDHSEQIAERILTEIDSGVTYLEGKGAYQNTDKKVILCVIRKQSMQKMEDIVRMEDENAFMIVSSASEIYGEGYKSYFMEKL